MGENIKNEKLEVCVFLWHIVTKLCWVDHVLQDEEARGCIDFGYESLLEGGMIKDLWGENPQWFLVLNALYLDCMTRS
jgi:hypothetical protein